MFLTKVFYNTKKLNIKKNNWLSVESREKNRWRNNRDDVDHFKKKFFVVDLMEKKLSYRFFFF